MDGEASIMRRIAQRARREHWPKPIAWALAYQGVAMVLVNAYLWWLVARNQLSPAALTAFCLGELLLLMAMACIERIPVPRDARFDGQHRQVLGTRRERSGFFGSLFVCVFMAVWLSGVYGFSMLADPNLQLLMSGVRPLEVIEGSNVLWPLLLSAVLATIAMAMNWQIWQRRGGTFVPELSQPNMPKVLTILLAPLPATMAMFSYIDDDGETAILAWCVTYLGIKCLLEAGMLALSLFGLYILDSLPPVPGQEAVADVPARSS